MRKINTIIISKEISTREFITRYLKRNPIIHIMGSYSTLLESFHSFSNNDIEIVFVDESNDAVQDILNTVEGTKPVIARMTFSEKSNSLNVENLHVSFSMSQYEQSMELIKTIANHLGNVTEYISPSNLKEVGDDFLFVRTNHSLVKIYFKKIFYIKAMENFVQIVTEIGTYMTLMTLKNILSHLPGNHFVQVHRSYIVNINEIKLLEKSTVKVDRYEVPIGGAYKNRLNELLMKKSNRK